ncbi:butyrophilin subfamily 3 member A2-like, partial [Salvelinus alpinus]|uniref:butyrophilin subfamily 3 member A2-like n=1 Tax=Salvelinus alpinus TaxID=8036 RepID=UPI0039FD4976
MKTPAAWCFGGIILYIGVSLRATGSSQIQLVGSADPVVALAGDDVILPCYLKPNVSAVDMMVAWTRSDLKTQRVHLYRDGRDSNGDQLPSYRGRTSLFIEELKNSNVSLKLTGVTLSDAGEYKCFIPTLTKETTILLIVGAVSQPVISINGTKGLGVVLKCDSGGWYPQPELEWLDSHGDVLSATEPTETSNSSETEMNPEGRYTVRRYVTVWKTDNNRYTCRVVQLQINQTRETQIHVPDDMFPNVGRIVGIILSAVAAFVALVVLFYCFRKQEREAGKNLDLQTKLDTEECIRQHVEEKVVGFLDARRPKLLDRVTNATPIAEALTSMIQEQDYRDISAAVTPVEKMRLLFTAVDSGGEEVKSAFYKSLMREEPDLVLDILKEEPDRVINLLGEELGIYPNTDDVDHSDESGSNRVEMMEMQPLLGPGSAMERGGRQAVDALEDQERGGRQAVDALEDQERGGRQAVDALEDQERGG